jgi:hypothetical protein
MLGITVPDAVLILGAVAALLTAYLGTQKGNSARRQSLQDAEAPGIGGMLADAATMRDLVEVLKLLVVTIQQGIESNQLRQKDDRAVVFRELLDRLAVKETKPGR